MDKIKVGIGLNIAVKFVFYYIAFFVVFRPEVTNPICHALSSVQFSQVVSSVVRGIPVVGWFLYLLCVTMVNILVIVVHLLHLNYVHLTIMVYIVVVFLMNRV